MDGERRGDSGILNYTPECKFSSKDGTIEFVLDHKTNDTVVLLPDGTFRETTDEDWKAYKIHFKLGNQADGDPNDSHHPHNDPDHPDHED